jgi:hypothetical protein
MGQPWVTAYIIQWIVIGILLIMFYQTLKLLGQYIRKVEKIERNTKRGLSVKTRFPKFHAESLTTASTIDTTSGRGNRLFLFVSPTCKACEDVLLDLYTLHLDPLTEMAVISMKSGEDSDFKYLQILQEKNISMVLDHSLFESLGIPSLPYGVVIDEQRNIVNHGEAGSIQEVNELVASLPILETA